jgi:hypothetical protein
MKWEAKNAESVCAWRSMGLAAEPLSLRDQG